MDFCTSYFGKSLPDLSYDDISDYFSEPRSENTTIEFKSFHERSTFDSGLQGVIKGICGFLNSEGGVLVWGAPHGSMPSGRTEDVFVGELRPVTTLTEKDRLINIITKAITRPPVGIKVQILADGGGHVYVFEIQESLAKPHQFNSQYYIRLDGQTRPAPHYIVEAMMRQVTYPNLHGYLKFSSLARNFYIPQNIEMNVSIGIFNLSELQNEEMVSIRVICTGGYFPHSKGMIPKTNPSYSFDSKQLIFDNLAAILHYGLPSAHDNMVVFNRQTLQVTSGVLELWLQFGGRKSPMKQSYYVFDFSGFDFKTGPDLPHPLKHLVKYEENVLAVDGMDRLHTSIEDTIRSFTER